MITEGREEYSGEKEKRESEGGKHRSGGSGNAKLALRGVRGEAGKEEQKKGGTRMVEGKKERGKGGEKDGKRGE